MSDARIPNGTEVAFSTHTAPAVDQVQGPHAAPSELGSRAQASLSPAAEISQIQRGGQPNHPVIQPNQGPDVSTSAVSPHALKAAREQRFLDGFDQSVKRNSFESPVESPRYLPTADPRRDLTRRGVLPHLEDDEIAFLEHKGYAPGLRRPTIDKTALERLASRTHQARMGFLRQEMLRATIEQSRQAQLLGVRADRLKTLSELIANKKNPPTPSRAIANHLLRSLFAAGVPLAKLPQLLRRRPMRKAKPAGSSLHASHDVGYGEHDGYHDDYTGIERKQHVDAAPQAPEPTFEIAEGL